MTRVYGYQETDRRLWCWCERFDKAIRIVTNVWYPHSATPCISHSVSVSLPRFRVRGVSRPTYIPSSFPINRSTSTLGVLFRQLFSGSHSHSQSHMMTSGDACPYYSPLSSPRLARFRVRSYSVVGFTFITVKREGSSLGVCDKI